LEFRDISRVPEAITSKRMKIYPYCQRLNCSPLSALFSDVQVTLISQGVHPLWASNKCGLRGEEKRHFRAKCVNVTRQMVLTAAALLQTSR